MSEITDAADDMRRLRENGLCGEFAEKRIEGNTEKIAVDYSELTEAVENLRAEVHVAKSNDITTNKLRELAKDVKQERYNCRLRGKLNTYLLRIESRIDDALSFDSCRDFQAIENELDDCIDILVTMQRMSEWLEENKNYKLV